MRQPASPQIAVQLALALCLGACRAEAPPGDQPRREAIRVEIQVPGSLPNSAGAASNSARAPRAAKPNPASAPRVAARHAAAADRSRDSELDGARPAGDAVQRVAQDPQADPPTSPRGSRDGALLPVSFSTQRAEQPASVIPALLDERDTLLPQTEQLPGTDSAFYEQLGRTLFQAIIDNNPELLIPYFMPVQVYAALKDSKNPPRDWKYRLYAQLTRDIARYHRLLGKDRARARFLGLDVKPEDAIWMKPGREYNKLSYFRLFGSRIRYSDPRGRERSFELSALFSWRGEWYIVHLNGLK